MFGPEVVFIMKLLLRKVTLESQSSQVSKLIHLWVSRCNKINDLLTEAGRKLPIESKLVCSL